MTPYKEEMPKTQKSSDDSVPSVSLYEFFDELLGESKFTEPAPQKRKTVRRQ